MSRSANTKAPTVRRSRRSSGRVTIAEVAQVAGMSMHTVSRVLNTPDQVPERTVLKIREAIASTGYVPNLLAGGLASGRSRLVAVLVPTIAGPVFLETLQALGDTLAAAGYQMMLGQSGYDDVNETDMLGAVLGRRPDGIVLTRIVTNDLARKQLRAAGIPIVETWDLSDDPIDMLIGFSHEAVGAGVAEFMHESSYRRLAAIVGDDPRAGRRHAAFLARAHELGMVGHDATHRTFWVHAPASIGEGRRGLAQLLQDDPTVDAVFCSTDMIALGALLEAASRGLRVPEDLAVVGFGDQRFAADTLPALTTVRIDGSRMGKQAAKMIVDRVEGRAVDRPVNDIGFELIRRASA